MGADGRLAGKACLVTGAGSGIGRAAALRFAQESGRVAAADLRGEAAEETASQIGGEAIGLEVDVTSAASVGACIECVVDAFGTLDVVVNNAGVTIVGAAHDLNESDWDRELATNLKSVYLVSKAAWPPLVESRGAIVNTASIAGLWAIPADAAYCASKAGVVMLTKCMALDGANYLASDEACWVTGTALVVDGGLTSGIWGGAVRSSSEPNATHPADTR